MAANDFLARFVRTHVLEVLPEQNPIRLIVQIEFWIKTGVDENLFGRFKYANGLFEKRPMRIRN